MADNEQDKSKKLTQPDLDALRGLSFGTNWSEATTGGSQRSDSREKSFGKGERSPRTKDRRPPREKRFDRSGDGPPDRRSGDRPARPRFREERPEREFFKPVVEVQFHPIETVFETLANAMRQSVRTYELFEIARLILGKPERHEVQIRPLPVEGGDTGKSAPGRKLFLSVPDQLPFLTEDAAVEHVLRNHLERYFSTEEVELEAPRGNFQFVTKCTFTEEIIGPPNYHLYAQMLQQHHATRVCHVPFETFRNRLQTIREEEVIQGWVEKMKKGVKYTLREEFTPPAGEDGEKKTLAYTSLEEARNCLLKELGKQVVQPVNSVKIAGSRVAEIPDEGIRRSIEGAFEYQNRFPMDTANALRSRLRRQRFYIYKKGSKGISYVCAVRRRYRQPDEVFAESVQKLLHFLDANPYIPAADLAEKYLGLTKPETEEDKKAIAARPEFIGMLTDLRWLLNEGYLMEYSDGRLFLPPVQDAGGGSPAKEKTAPRDSTDEPSGDPKTETAAEPSPEADQNASEPDPDPSLAAEQDSASGETDPSVGLIEADQPVEPRQESTEDSPVRPEQPNS